MQYQKPNSVPPETMPAVPTARTRDRPASEAPSGAAGADPASLAARAASGDASAWEALVRQYWRRVYALALSRLRNDHAAEEITQSVFVTVAEQLTTGAYSEAARFESWLFTITMNRVRDEARRRRRDDRAAADPRAAAPTSEPGPAPPGESLAELRDAVCSLDQLDQDILRLRHQGGLAFRRIADVLGAPLGTVLARHHRALSKLRDLLAEAPPAGANQKRNKP